MSSENAGAAADNEIADKQARMAFLMVSLLDQASGWPI
jgi:hypothetical protein